MIRYIIRRLLWAVVLFIAVTIVTYIIFFVIPADPARAFAGKNPTPDQIVRARHYLGIDKPVPVQYARFLWRLTYHHSLGRSFANREPVNTLVFSAAPVTASLVIGGAIFTESIYGLPGLGRVSLQGLNNLDLPTVMGVVVFATTMIILFNLVVDILYAWIDPRIRLT